MSRWEAEVYLIEVVIDISRKATVAQVEEIVVSRCFAECLVQARNHCSNRCSGLRNNASGVQPTDAAGVKPPNQNLAPVFCGMSRAGSCWCMRLLLLAKIVKF